MSHSAAGASGGPSEYKTKDGTGTVSSKTQMASPGPSSEDRASSNSPGCVSGSPPVSPIPLPLVLRRSPIAQGPVVGGIPWTASRTTLVPAGDEVRVVRETVDAARVRPIRASLVVARQDPTPAQATAALTRLATYFSAPRRSPSVDSGAGSESVEEVKKKRKPAETPEDLRRQLERERATAQAMKEQQKAARDQRSALRAAARAETLAQQEAAERRSPIGRRPISNREPALVDPTSTEPPAVYLARRARERAEAQARLDNLAQIVRGRAATSSAPGQGSTERGGAKSRKKRASRRPTPEPRPRFPTLNFHSVHFQPLGVRLVDGKALAQVSTSPFHPPPETLLFVDEDMVPPLDLGQLPGDRVDNLYSETACPYWHPRIKRNMISRVDRVTKLPVSRAGRIRLSPEETAARETVRLQVRNRKRHLLAQVCMDQDMVQWERWRRAAKAQEPVLRPASPAQQESEEEFYSGKEGEEEEGSNHQSGSE